MSRRYIVPIDFSGYDPNEEIPTLIGDPKGEVLIAKGELVGFAAEWGTGKTILSGALAVSLAFGRDIFGHGITEQHKVLAVMADNDSFKSIRKRICRFAASLGITKEQLQECGRLYICAPVGFHLDDAGCTKELHEELASFDPDVVLAETLTTLAGPQTKMTEQGDAARFVATKLRALQTRPDDTRRTVLAKGHLIKPRGSGGNIRNQIAGSFAVAAGFDAIIGLENLGRSRVFNIVEVKASREGGTFEPFTVDIIGDRNEPLRLVRREYEEPRRRKGREKSKDRAMCEAIIRDYTADHLDAKRKDAIAACEAAGKSRATASRAWNDYRDGR